MLKNMKIGNRLITAFIISILISSIAGITGIVLLTKSDSDYSKVLQNYGFAQGELGNLGRHFQASRVVNLNVMSASNSADRAEYMQELASEDAGVDKYLEQIKGRTTTAEGQQQIAKLSTQMQDFRTARGRAFDETATSTNTSANIEKYHEIVNPSSTDVRLTLDAMIASRSSDGIEMSIGLTQQMSIFRWIMSAIMVVAVIVAIILAYIIAGGISKPITQIEEAAARMAKGDFDVDVVNDSRDEIGSLTNSMHQMIATTRLIIKDTARGLGEIEKGNFNIAPEVEYVGVFQGIQKAMVGIIDGLSDALSQINVASDQVSAGSDQVSSGAQALSQGATEQAASVQELAATVVEISSQVMKNAQSSQNASAIVNSTAKEIVQSNEKMQLLIEAMSEISTSSQEIGKVIKTIEDIAFQTNILALNAAVEAARAGAAGKGFAVVADEVRNLASKSAIAAKSTTLMIEGSVKSVEKGTSLVADTAKSLLSVVDGAREATRMVDLISVASVEQASSIEQVTLGIDQISNVVQTNSATAEESAAASEELSGQAQMLKSLVSTFKLKAGTEHAKYSPKATVHKNIVSNSSSYDSYNSHAGKY